MAHVAMQRALRAVVIQFRGELGLALFQANGGGTLTDEEKEAYLPLAGAVADGIAIGLRAARA